MNTIFVGGSRHVSHLPELAVERLDNILNQGDAVIVGDAAGADKAVQTRLRNAQYGKVTVFCSGDVPRNNIGNWPVERVHPPASARGFQFHAAKDRAMAGRADFGLMVWDGKSVGTLLNVLRLIQAGKKAVLIHAAEQRALTIKSADDWLDLVRHADQALVDELRRKATAGEWIDPGHRAPVDAGGATRALI